MLATTSQTAHRTIGFLLLALGVLLLVFATFLLVTVAAHSPLWQQDPQSAIVSIPVPFALVFLTIGWRSLRFAPGCRETLSLSAWKRLAYALLLAGLAMALVYHWLAFFLPAVVAGVCLARDPIVIEKLLWLWPF